MDLKNHFNCLVEKLEQTLTQRLVGGEVYVKDYGDYTDLVLYQEGKYYDRGRLDKTFVKGVKVLDLYTNDTEGLHFDVDLILQDGVLETSTEILIDLGYLHHNYMKEFRLNMNHYITINFPYNELGNTINVNSKKFVTIDSTKSINIKRVNFLEYRQDYISLVVELDCKEPINKRVKYKLNDFQLKKL